MQYMFKTGKKQKKEVSVIGYRPKKSWDKWDTKANTNTNLTCFTLTIWNNVSYSNLRTVCANCQKLHLGGWLAR